MKSQLFNSIDLIMVPIILLIIGAGLFFYKKKQEAELQKYFYSAFFLRVAGTLAIAIIYQFIYGYGDTFAYYYNAQALTDFFFKDAGVFFDVIFSDPSRESENLSIYLQSISSYNEIYAIIFQSSENANVSKAAAVFNIICADSYLGIALFFGTLSFFGCWYIFKTFTHLFPGYEKQFAWMCLYLPSLWFWGNGILKDPLCIFGLGLLFYNFFVKRKSTVKRIFLLILGAYILVSIKSYIFYAFLMAAITGRGLVIFTKGNLIIKFLLIILFISSAGVAYFAFSDQIAQSFADMILTSEQFSKSYAAYAIEGDGSLITEFDPSPLGFLKLSLTGLVNVYMKPFPWDVRKVLYLFLILENLFLYYIIFRKIKKGPVAFHINAGMLINFCLIFTFIMGIIIGVTTFNLGTIARYRVPALPFLFAGVFSLKLLIRKKRVIKADGNTDHGFLPTA